MEVGEQLGSLNGLDYRHVLSADSLRLFKRTALNTGRLVNNHS